MEQFKQIGFTQIEFEMAEELVRLNPKLTPQLIRYQGMGNYTVLVKGETGFQLAAIGGENGWTTEANEKEYAQLTEALLTLEEALEKARKGSWTQITRVEEFDGGTCQETINHDE